jgi:hypothetical protein
MAVPQLPFALREAVVAVSGKCFWLKDPFKAFYLSCGVDEQLYDRYADESKYKIARHVLAELDKQGEEGYFIQRKLITALCNLRNVPDDSVPDRAAGLSALRQLKELALEHGVVARKQQADKSTRAEAAERRTAAMEARRQKVNELRELFYRLAASSDDPQNRGYGLEDLLAELFALHEIQYRPPYKTETEQIDGSFSFKGFDYLVEARWRAQPPKEADLAAFKMKVDKKLTSTRGVFFSIMGYRVEVLNEFTRGITSNIVLFDGHDLSLILEGHVSLIDALDLKIQKAAQEGILHFPLAKRFG